MSKVNNNSQVMMKAIASKKRQNQIAKILDDVKSQNDQMKSLMKDIRLAEKEQKVNGSDRYLCSARGEDILCFIKERGMAKCLKDLGGSDVAIAKKHQDVEDLDDNITYCRQINVRGRGAVACLNKALKQAKIIRKKSKGLPIVSASAPGVDIDVAKTIKTIKTIKTKSAAPSANKNKKKGSASAVANAALKKKKKISVAKPTKIKKEKESAVEEEGKEEGEIVENSSAYSSSSDIINTNVEA